MSRTTFAALAAGALTAASVALATSRPAHAAPDPCSDVDGSCTTASCGRGHLYLCSITYAYHCDAWGYAMDGSATCLKYTVTKTYVWRD